MESGKNPAKCRETIYNTDLADGFLQILESSVEETSTEGAEGSTDETTAQETSAEDAAA